MENKIEIWHCTWKMGSLYRSSSLKTAARELGRCKLDTVGTQEVRWGKRGTVKPGDCILFYKKNN